MVTVLLSLHTMGAGGDAQGKGSLIVGSNHLLTGIVHHITVKLERYARHGDAGVAIVHMARIDVVGIHVEVEVLRPVRTLGKGYHTIFIRTGITAIPYRDVVFAGGLIGQVRELVETCLVGRLCVFRTCTSDSASWRARDHDTCHCSTVGHTHIAAYPTRWDTLGTQNLG